MYYYFIKKRGVLYTIFESNIIIDTIMNPSFVLMTQEQIDFYLNNPNATIHEIEQCQLNTTFEIPISEYKELIKKEIDSYSRQKLSSVVDTLAFANAVAGTLYANQRGLDSVSSKEKILTDTDNFLIFGNKCNERLNNDFTLIDNANTLEEINTIKENSKNYFDTLSINENDIEYQKQLKLREIDLYDTSENVNGFFYNNMLMWLDKTTRNSLVNTLNSALLLGRERVNIWFQNFSVSLDITEARQLLAALELYASDCYSVTALHKSQIEEMTNIDDVINFDITLGYPDRLNINTTRNIQENNDIDNERLE